MLLIYVLFIVTFLRLASLVIINNELPLLLQDKPLYINTSVMVESVGSIRSQDMDFQFEYLAEYEWSTELQICESLYLSRLSKPNLSDIIITGSQVINSFWVPNTYVPQAKKIELESSVENNQVLRIKVKDGRCSFKYRVRLEALVFCRMDFKHYPNDQQECSFSMKSNLHPISHVKYVWKDFIIRPTLGKLAQFEVNINSTHKEILDLDGALYTWLIINFTFERRLPHFIIHGVIPSMLLISVAYCSCWIKFNYGPGRYLLCVLTFLALITMYSGSKNELPKTSYLLAIDVWMITCMIFIFSAIIQLIVVSFIEDKRKLRRNRRCRRLVKSDRRKSESMRHLVAPCCLNNSFKRLSPNNNLSNNNLSSYQTFSDVYAGKSWNGFTDAPAITINETSAEAQATWTSNKTLKMDIYFRVLYPILFVCFNLVYWPLLLSRCLM